MADRIVPLTWYGSKAQQLSKILPCLPQMPKYVEPFGGSAVVMLNRPTAPLEVYNDIYGEVVNLFRVLRDNGDKLIDLLALTPYSREEYIESFSVNTTDSDVERARKFYIRIGQSFSGAGKSKGQWSRDRTISVGMARRIRTYLARVEGLEEIVQRLRYVQIENNDALDVFRFYDSTETLTYLDPPYMTTTRIAKSIYNHEISEAYHIRLLELLTRAKGSVAISGYQNDLYESYLKSFHLYTWDTRSSSASGKGLVSREECLWANYDVSYVVLSLFGIEKIR